MVTRALSGTIGLVLLAACAGEVPDSGQGAGYSSDFSRFEIERAREEAARNAVQAAPAGAIPRGDLAAAGIGAPAVATGPIGAPVAAPRPASALPAGPSNAPVRIASSGISDEQDFDAVADRETIESDAERRAAQQAAYQVIAPEALPQRTQAGPNIVEYALAAPNRLGQEWWSRSLLVINRQGKFERNCATYRSPDEAQRDFLARGGPERDPRGIDPDGDGFACGWDPAPFLAAVGRS